jgi:hypothetical protein
VSTSGQSVEDARAALKEVESFASSLEMFSTDFAGMTQLPNVGMRRRRLRSGDPDPVATTSLVRNDDGVLLWTEGAVHGSAARRLRRGNTPTAEGELVELYHYKRLEPNEINAFLIKLDGHLNPSTGLWRLQHTPPAHGQPAQISHVPTDVPTGKKRRLVFVHGTFSKSQAFVNGVGLAPNGNDFWKKVFDHYEEVFAFDHPTLSVSPMLNAFDLHRLLGRATGPLDIIAHSRGGLVTRWFLEGFGGANGDGPYRALLVGSPLGGTSLASPPRLRDTLSLLTNIGTVLRVAGAASVVFLPLLAAPLALLKIATSVVSLAAKTPVIDAAVSMIPGLAGQSRVDLNQELERVHTFNLAKPPTYFVVQSNFETEKPGWKFWQWFRKDKLKDFATNKIFDGPNDLVVDTGSMTEFQAKIDGAPPPVPLPAQRQLDFGTTPDVHHTNYFEQKATLDFAMESLMK